MKNFTDTAGREWALSLTIDSVKRVRALLDVNLLELEAGDPSLLTKLGTDVILLCDVIFVLVKPQADKAGVTDEQFGAALGGDVILAAQAAFYDEIIDFFRRLSRGDIATAVEAQRRMIDLAVARIEMEIPVLERKITTKMAAMDLEAEADLILGKLSMSSPE